MKFFILLCISMSLHIEALVWSQPVDISTNFNSSYYPDVAVDGQGNAIAVWQSNTTPNTIYAATKILGQDWSSPILISDPSLISHFPSIAMNDSGYAMAVWVSIVGENYNLYFATTTFGESSWSSPTVIPTVHPVPFFGSEPLAIEMDSGGNAIIVWDIWNPPTTPNVIIQAAVIPYLGSPTVTSLSSALVPSINFSLSMNSSGNAVVSWTQNDNIQAILYSGGSWGLATTISSLAGNFDYSQTVIDPSSNVTVAWPLQSAPFEIQYAQYPFGGPWSEVTTINNTSTEYLPPQLVATSTGTVIMTWPQFETENTSLMQSTTIPLGSGPTPITTISLPNDSAYTPDLTIDASNNAYLVWTTNPNISDVTYLKTSTLPFEGSWAKPFIISDNLTGKVFVPVIASNLPNEAVATWVFQTGVINLIESASGTSIQPPLVIQGNQVLHRFPTQGDLINSLFWTPPHTHGIDRYRIYRTTPSNLIGEVSIPNFQDHQRVPGISDTYFITALTAGDEESDSGTITIP